MQRLEKPKGQYDWDSDSAIEITVRVNRIFHGAPKLPELPPKPAQTENTGFNKGTDSTLKSISTNSKNYPDSVDFLKPEEPEVPEVLDKAGSGNVQSPFRTSLRHRVFSRVRKFKK
jgi:hypothetical protein